MLLENKIILFMNQKPNKKAIVAEIVQDITNVEDQINKLKEKVSLLSGENININTEQNLQQVKDVDFTLPQRAFMTKYATGTGKNKKSGAQKFVLVMAYLVKGQIGQNVSFDDITKCWNTMSGKNKLGKFNNFYSSDAKDNGWVDSPRHGVYHLRKDWQKVLKAKLK